MISLSRPYMVRVCVYLQCKEICIETQDNFLKELRDFGEVGVIRCEVIVNGVYCKQYLPKAPISSTMECPVATIYGDLNC